MLLDSCIKHYWVESNADPATLKQAQDIIATVTAGQARAAAAQATATETSHKSGDHQIPKPKAVLKPIQMQTSDSEHRDHMKGQATAKGQVTAI